MAKNTTTFGVERRPVGRPKGVPNKTTIAIKQAITIAFDKAGGVGALTKWAKENQTEFYKIWAKLLPQDVKVSGRLTLEQLLAETVTPTPPDQDHA